jgi:flavin reductase (DIM6/NTAB) family NADH-FMN oxidoreductase RutF
MQTLFYDPRCPERPAELRHNPFPALVAPRPIAWVSSIGRGGDLNLAPFSHFNIVSVEPPMVMFAPNTKDHAGNPKDTLRNIREVPEFVVSLVSWKQREAMNVTSSELRYGENEFTIAGIESAPSVSVRPPRVADSKAALECKVWRIIDLPTGKTQRQCHIVIGEVVGVHISPEVIVSGKVSSTRLEQVARLGYFEYLAVRETFEMRRPDRAD